MVSRVTGHMRYAGRQPSPGRFVPHCASVAERGARTPGAAPGCM